MESPPVPSHSVPLRPGPQKSGAIIPKTKCSRGKVHRGRSCQDATLSMWGLGIGSCCCQPGLPVNCAPPLFLKTVSYRGDRLYGGKGEIPGR